MTLKTDQQRVFAEGYDMPMPMLGLAGSAAEHSLLDALADLCRRANQCPDRAHRDQLRVKVDELRALLLSLIGDFRVMSEDELAIMMAGLHGPGAPPSGGLSS